MRKTKNIFALCLSLIMIILTVGGISAVGAASIDAEAYFSAEDDSFIVEGTVNDSETDNVSIFIYRPGYTLEMVENGEATLQNAVCNTHAMRLASDSFSYKCKASAKDTTGYYTVYIKYGVNDLLKLENIYYADSGEVIKSLERIEAATGTPEEKFAAFNDELKYIGSLPDEYYLLSEQQKIDTIDSVIAEGIKFDSVKALKDAVSDKSIQLLLLNPARADTVKYVIDNYNDKAGYDIENKLYKKYVADYADRISAVYQYTVSKAPFTEVSEAKAAFQKGVILQALNNIETKGELYSTAINSVSILGDTDNVELLIGLGLNMTGYKNLTDVKQDAMLTKFFKDKKYKAATIEAFVSNWNTAVKEAPTLSIDSAQSGGGGGGKISNDPSSITVGGDLTTGIQGGSVENNTPVPDDTYFTDLAGVEWAKESIVSLAKAGIVNGKDAYSFAPNDNITREEFLKMLYLCANLQINEDAQTTFIDVNKGDWYYGIVASAQEQSLVNGVSNVRFGVGENITRQDMAVMIVRMVSSLGVELKLSSDESQFTDHSNIAPYANVSVYTMKKAGIINGYEDGSFKPNAYATRAEAAKIIFALCSLMVD